MMNTIENFCIRMDERRGTMSRIILNVLKNMNIDENKKKAITDDFKSFFKNEQQKLIKKFQQQSLLDNNLCKDENHLKNEKNYATKLGARGNGI